jgi:competence protein ComEC
LELGGIDTVALLLAVVGVSVLCFLPSVMPLRYFSLLLCMPLLLPKSMVLPTGVADIRVLDVGQGLSVVVRTQHAVLVYDVGDKYSERFDAGRDIVATTLRNFRRKTIDMLMISHADSDHAGGRHGLLQEVSAKQLWSGTPEQLEKNVDGSDVYFPCDAGMHWRWDDVDFRVLSPDVSRTNHSENDQSCVVMIEVGSHRVLLTADIEKNTEQSLVDTHADLRADVLLSPHHGSKTSSSPQFLTAVGAKTVVISAGYLNRFHHPAKAVVERYTARDMRMFNTAEQGAVRMQLSKAGVTVDSALCSKPVFWHRDRYNAHCLSDATEPDFAR